ncbi:MAG TPA: hypothetical protein VGB38_01255, partial [bacterium]
MHKRNLLFWIGLSAFFTQTLFADGERGQAGAFLRYGIGGRTLGMGRTYAASTEDANSTGLNPAGLVGAKRLEITSMYSNLFYDSRYAHVGIVVPRPFEATKLGILRYLFGPNTAFGLSWIGLGMVGFEQRSSSGERVGEFGLNEDALLLAWAREETGSWGLLRYGLAFKGVHQGYPGLAEVSELDLSSISRSWTWGMDAGLSFQPIHAPILDVVSLRYLVPLRLGFVVKNVARPSWKTASAEDRFPRTFRTGLSYRWILKDWIPVSWTAIRYLTGNAQLLTAFDWEWMQDHSNRTVYQGSFFGIEGFIPLSENAICVCPRFGFHDRKDGPSVGIGVLLPFSKLASMQMDYAYGFHPYLPNDSRFFLTLRVGPDKGVGYFKRQAQKSVEQGRSERVWLLKTIAAYPETDAHLAARSLAAMENDSAHIRRYYNLIGGIDLANCLFVDAKNLLRQDKTKEAQQKASDAVREYNALYNQREENPLSDTDITNYGET